MRLEIKHIAAYLQYGLLCKGKDGIFRVDEIKTSSLWKIWAHDRTKWKDGKIIADDQNGSYLGNLSGKGHFIFNLKPLLYKFDTDSLKMLEVFEFILKVRGDQFDNKIENIKFWVHAIATENILDLPQYICEKCYQLNIDVFGLNEAGLAIDKLLL